MAHQWVAPNDYLEQFQSVDIFNGMDPFDFIPGIVPDDGNELWWDAPLVIEGFDLLGSPLPHIDLMTLPSTMADPYTPIPTTLPASMVFCGGVWRDPIPPTPRFAPIPLPPETSGDDTWGRGDFCGGCGGNDDIDDRGNDDFLAQEAEMSRSLATAKPEYIENGARSRSSSIATSSSVGGYDRTKNAKEKVLRFAQIREVLQIPSTEGELPILQTIIQLLGGTVLQIEEPSTWLTKPQRAKRNRRARRAYFEEVKSLVGPHTDKLYELKVLDHALESLTNRSGEPSGSITEYEPYGVFRAW